MPHLALEQVGDGGEADVRMRPHVDAVADQELGRPHLVEEDEGPDHLLLRRGQRAAHLEAAEIAGARHDHVLDGIAGVRDRREWGLGRVASSRVTSFSGSPPIANLVSPGASAKTLTLPREGTCRSP